MVPMKNDAVTYCEICGSEIEGQGYHVKIEGSPMIICRRCYEKNKKHLVMIPKETKQVQTRPKTIVKRDEVELDIDENYPRIIREGRERMHLSTNELAEKMKVKENIIKRIELGKLKPTISEARVIERILGVKLVVEVSSGKKETSESDSQTLTLGDIIKIREGRK
ncbi:MAG: multiprotein bridging factor aMBF1 [Metallosphaera sp.]